MSEVQPVTSQEIVKEGVSINQGRRETVDNMDVVGLPAEHVAQNQRRRAPDFQPGRMIDLGAEIAQKLQDGFRLGSVRDAPGK